MDRRLVEVAAGLALLLLIVTGYSSTPRGAFDDLAVLRASAWLGTCNVDDGLPRALQAHLERYTSQLPLTVRERFRLRTEFATNHALIAPMVRFAERANVFPVLINVILACLVQHLLVAGGVLLLAWRSRTWLLLALLAGARLGVCSWPSRLDDFFAFQRDNLSWLAAAPRGATVLAWFGALVAWLGLGGFARLAAALGFTVIAFLCHRSMAVLCFGSTVPILGLWWTLRDRIAWRPRPVAMLAAFGALALLAAGVKLALLLHYDSQTLFPLAPRPSRGAPSPLRPALTLVAWSATVAVALWCWLRARGSAMLNRQSRRGGDTLAVLLAITGAVGLGLNAVHPGVDLWYGPLFFITEGSLRMGAIPNVLFFGLAGLTLQALAPRRVMQALLTLTLVGVLLAALLLMRPKELPLPSSAPPLVTLLERGRGAYSDEVTYFISVATALAAHGCGRP